MILLCFLLMELSLGGASIKLSETVKFALDRETQPVSFKVDVTDTTVVPAYYGHDCCVYSTDPL